MNKSQSKTTVADTDHDAYKHWTGVTLRYGDTDRQGHVNNAVFATFYESGRVSFLFDDRVCLAGPGRNFVIARLTLDFLSELNFPGTVEVGSAIIAIGRSSFTVAQAIFKDGICVSTSQSVIVQIDSESKRSSSLSQDLVGKLKQLM